MDKAIIVGAGTYGQVYASYILDSKQYEVIAFLDDDARKIGNIIQSIPVIGRVSFLEELANESSCSVFVPIGNNAIRKKILDQAREYGMQTPGYIHPSSNIHPSVQIGKSVYILPSTNIMPHTVIHDNVMISMGVNIAHHTVLGANTFVSQGVNIGASINIEEFAFIGIGATLMTGISTIGANSVIGAGSVIIRDVPPFSVIAGNPGRIVKIIDH